jgi:hypothetical protein
MSGDRRGRQHSLRVIEVLSKLVSTHGAPRYLRSGNGPEFVSRAILRWLAEANIDTAHIDPGKPWQNCSMRIFASIRFLNHCRLKHSSRNLPLKDSFDPVLAGVQRDPASLESRAAHAAAIQTDPINNNRGSLFFEVADGPKKAGRSVARLQSLRLKRSEMGHGVTVTQDELQGFFSVNPPTASGDTSGKTPTLGCSTSSEPYSPGTNL